MRQRKVPQLQLVAIRHTHTVNADDASGNWNISKIYPEVRASQFEIDLRFTADTPPQIRRGQTLQMQLVLGDAAERATLLANGPFFNDTGGAWVFVLDPDGKIATRRPVQLGRRNPSTIEVESGLVAGDQVIISSYANFIEVDRLLIGQ